jgi:hypothetical protein
VAQKKGEKMKIQSQNYLKGSAIYDYEELKQWICNQNYTKIHDKIPSARYRGTSIIKQDSGFIITGWNRNIGQINEMVFSFPCILKIVVNTIGVIENAEIDSCFRGSKGKLCDWGCLNETVQKEIVGKNIITCADENISVEKLKCFHVFEVIAAAGSVFRIMKEYGKEEFFEEELMEGAYIHNEFGLMGKHNFITLDKNISFRFVFPELKKSIAFQSDGSITFSERILSHFILDEEIVFSNILQGTTKNRSFVSLAVFAKKALEAVKGKYFNHIKDSFYCTNMHPNSFIGGYMQSVAMNLGLSDISSFQKSMNLLRADENGPKCIGG